MASVKWIALAADEKKSNEEPLDVGATLSDCVGLQAGQLSLAGNSIDNIAHNDTAPTEPKQDGAKAEDADETEIDILDEAESYSN